MSQNTDLQVSYSRTSLTSTSHSASHLARTEGLFDAHLPDLNISLIHSPQAEASVGKERYEKNGTHTV